MIDISGHLRNFRRENGFEDYSKPIVINCCGYQKFMTKNFSKTRSAGRLDYQLLYIFKGGGEYVINGKKEFLSSGNIILYKPDEPQVYSYHYEDSPEVYWIHFTGKDIPDLLKNFNIHSGYIGENIQLKNIFQEIILELQLKKTCFDSIVNSSFQKLLAVICRSYTDAANFSKDLFRLERLIVQLNKNYQRQWTIEDMAQYCNLSEGYFGHYFKEVMKVSPMQYLSELRISKAKDLLLGDNVSIASVADSLGYMDPLYFSRVFKKITGLSPTMYQKNYLLIENNLTPELL